MNFDKFIPIRYEFVGGVEFINPLSGIAVYPGYPEIPSISGSARRITAIVVVIETYIRIHPARSSREIQFITVSCGSGEEITGKILTDTRSIVLTYSARYGLKSYIPSIVEWFCISSAAYTEYEHEGKKFSHKIARKVVIDTTYS